MLVVKDVTKIILVGGDVIPALPRLKPVKTNRMYFMDNEIILLGNAERPSGFSFTAYFVNDEGRVRIYDVSLPRDMLGTFEQDLEDL